MKKLLALLLVLALTTALLSGCASGPPNPPENHPLIGSWVWDGNTLFSYLFERNGEGTRGAAAEQDETFTWTVSDEGSVTLNVGDDGAVETWDYAIDGHVLTLTSAQFGLEYVYIKANVGAAPQDGPLVGTWIWDGNPDWAFVFDANGEGVRGTDENQETFVWWTTADGGVLMYLGLRVDRWTYTINGDILTLTSRQEIGMEFSYIRAN